MLAGMAIAGGGLALGVAALFSQRPVRARHRFVPVYGHGDLRAAHWPLSGVLIVALAIDTMKPLTIIDHAEQQGGNRWIPTRYSRTY
jgi:hypothetical protein